MQASPPPPSQQLPPQGPTFSCRVLLASGPLHRPLPRPRTHPSRLLLASAFRSQHNTLPPNSQPFLSSSSPALTSFHLGAHTIPDFIMLFSLTLTAPLPTAPGSELPVVGCGCACWTTSRCPGLSQRGGQVGAWLQALKN